MQGDPEESMGQLIRSASGQTTFNFALVDAPLDRTKFPASSYPRAFLRMLGDKGTPHLRHIDLCLGTYNFLGCPLVTGHGIRFDLVAAFLAERQGLSATCKMTATFSIQYDSDMNIFINPPGNPNVSTPPARSLLRFDISFLEPDRKIIDATVKEIFAADYRILRNALLQGVYAEHVYTMLLERLDLSHRTVLILLSGLGWKIS
jgi:hypothetical protein